MGGSRGEEREKGRKGGKKGRGLTEGGGRWEAYMDPAVGREGKEAYVVLA